MTSQLSTIVDGCIRACTLPRYSPLCDTDRAAYFAYLAACCCNGSNNERVEQLDGSGEGSGCDGGRDNVGGGSPCALLRSALAEDLAGVAGVSDTFVSLCKSGAVGGGAGGAQSGDRRAGGLAVSDAGEGSRELCGGVGDDAKAPVSEDSACRRGPVVVDVRGPNWERNNRSRLAAKRRAERRRAMQTDWRRPAGQSVPSLCGTACTVSTRTADEVDAAKTLAKRRVAENKLAEIRANRLIASYADVDKTAAIEKLQVVRLEERINTAKARSQASYKKCDESLKSLGSTGSAGEFALKKQIKDTKKLEARLQYVHDQFAAVYPLLSQEAIDRANAVPEPKFPTDFEVFGDCPADYTEEEREAYYLDMNVEAGEIF